MKNYIRPNMEVSKFDVADIITVSGQVMSANDLTAADDVALYNAYKDASSVDSTDVAMFEW